MRVRDVPGAAAMSRAEGPEPAQAQDPASGDGGAVTAPALVIGTGEMGRLLAAHLAEAGGAVTVRTRRGEETLRPDAARPARSLRDLFQAQGVPPWRRAGWPLVYCGGSRKERLAREREKVNSALEAGKQAYREEKSKA